EHDAAGLPGLRAAVERNLQTYLADLRQVVDIDCGTFLPDGVNAVADVLQRRFESWGWTAQRIPHRPGLGEEQLGDVLVARIEGGAQGRVLLVGHMDTVFSVGAAKDRPFRMEGSRAFGPGVVDMKDGLLAGLYAVRALQDTRARFGSISYVCNPDEEIGSPFSSAVIREAAAAADVCFVLESARQDGDIVSSRKGVRDFHIVYTGRAAHAGVEPERGRSATLQAAHTTVALHGLNGRWDGVTVNVGVLQGGTRPNVVADRCEVQADMRAPTAGSYEEARAEIERIARDTVVPDLSVEISSRSSFPPMERSQATAALVDRAVAIARDLGFELGETATGGASDANAVAALGVPTLDGLGPVGGAAHSPEEWLDLDSVVPRTTLLAALIASS
ncbi:MAG TPA: M20 family metallopeptidase, partial [Actinomycetota bacterium]